MYKNFSGDGSASFKKRKWNETYVPVTKNKASLRPEPDTTQKTITHWGVNGPSSTRPDSVILNHGANVPIANHADRYIFQVPGTQGTPMVRRTGDPLYSDRFSQHVFVSSIRLDFQIYYHVPVRVRVFAFRKDNFGDASDFGFRAGGHEVNFFNFVRSGSGVGNASALHGVLTDDGSSPLQTGRAADG